MSPTDSHTITVRAFDLADNLRIASVTFVVDVTAPIVTIIIPSEDAPVTSIDVTWNGSDATSGIAGYQYRIDSGSWSTSAMDLAHIFNGQIDGGHIIEVKATDRSNNFAIASVNLTLDTSDPYRRHNLARQPITTRAPRRSRSAGTGMTSSPPSRATSIMSTARIGPR